MDIQPNQCGNCTHFVKQAGMQAAANLKQVLGICRRFPPTNLLVPGPQGQPILNTAFPNTIAENLCGEHTRDFTS